MQTCRYIFIVRANKFFMLGSLPQTMADQNLILESLHQIMEWILAGAVIAMVLRIADKIDPWLSIGLMLLLVIIIALPATLFLKWLEQNFRKNEE